MSSARKTSTLDNCNFWCQTDGDNMKRGGGNHKTRFVWQVKNFSSRPEQKGEFIESDSFTVIAPNGVATNWKLVLYPKGTSSADEGYVSVFLKIIDTKARASYELRFSHDGLEIDTIAKGKGIEFQPKEPRGDKNASSIDEVEEIWLFDDILTLVCEMSIQEAFYESEPSPESQMMEDLGKAYREKHSLDVTVKCGDVSFECNKFMLMTRSPVFKAMLQQDTLESQTNVVKINDIEPKVLEEMLLYIHTGESPNIKDLAMEFLAAADFYQLDELKNSCQSFFSDTLHTENSIGILILSDKYSASKLKKDALKFISENMKSISTLSDWKKELSGYPSLQSEIIESLMKLVP